MEQEEKLDNSGEGEDQNDNSKLKIDQTPIQPKLCNFDYIDMSKVHGNLEIIFEDKGKNESDFVYQHELFKHLNQQRKDEIRQSSKTIGNSHQEGDSITSEDKTIDFQVVAQKVALEEGDTDLFQKIPDMKFNEIKELVFNKNKEHIRLIEENYSVTSEEIDEEIDKSMIQEFWEDFDEENNIRPEK